MTLSDWHYAVVGIPTYPTTYFADYPKIAVDPVHIYITTQDFDAITSVHQQIIAVSKANLMAGLGATVVFSQLLNISTHDFPYPVENRAPASSPSHYRQYFVAFNRNLEPAVAFTGTATGIRIMRTNIVTVGGAMTETVFPFGTGLPTLRSTNQGVEQPPGLISGNKSATLPAFAVAMTGVRNGNSLYFAHTYQSASTGIDDDAAGVFFPALNATGKPSPGRPVVRWYEFDISRDALEDVITLKQWGDVIPEDGESGLSMPFINVDSEGNMAIGFTLSGPRQLPSVAYTGRHHTDPLGTTRYPIIVATTSTYPYVPAGTANPRWGDYSKLDVDPVDGRTFYIHGQSTSPRLTNGPGDSANLWSTDMATFKIERLAYPPKILTTPKKTIGSSVEDLLYTSNGGLAPTEEEEEGRPWGPLCLATAADGVMDPFCVAIEAALGEEVFMNGPGEEDE